MDWRTQFDADSHLDLAHFPDDYTRDHLRMWLTGFLHDDVRANVGQRICDLTRDDPGLIGSHSWPELDDMAQRV